MVAASGSLLPRLFQEAAAEQALRTNVLVRADTGAGKTFIAIMLMRQVAAMPVAKSMSGDEPKRLIVFLTPTTTLVHQQAQVVESQTSLRVKSFIGALGVDYWQREKWVEELHDADVVVMTPQIWLDVLRNAYYQLSHVQLMVFDEAHHAQKAHPYALIMREHYHPPKQRGMPVPRILGLTASPIWNVKRPYETVRNLESTLDARVLEIAKRHSEEMTKVSPRATETLVEHDLPRPDQLVLPFSNEEVVKLDMRTLDRILAALKLFGQLGAKLCAQQALEGRHLSASTLAELEGSFAIEATSTALSPKVAALVNVLLDFKDEPTFHAIVFVEQRHHALILVELLQRVRQLQGIVRPAALVGHGGRAFREGQGRPTEKDFGITVKEQNAVVAKFRTGEVNLLVATRIAEEGLDVPSCHLVIRFDALTTITGYVQSRGRARAAHARFVVLAERDSPEAQRYSTYVSQERDLLDLYSKRPEEADDPNEPDLDGLPTYTTRAGALLTHASAVPLIAQFCQLLRFDAFTSIQKPEYIVEGSGTSWQVTLHVPKTAALTSNVFVSKTMSTKRAAKQNASFQAAIALHEASALDDYLLPVREPAGAGAKDADGRDIAAGTLPGHVEVSLLQSFGNVWASDCAYVHVVELVRISGTTRVALVCGAPLRALEAATLNDRDGTPLQLRVLGIQEQRWADETDRSSRLAHLEHLNRVCTQVVLNRRINDEKFCALWAPVTSSNEIDWAAVVGAFRPLDVLKQGELVLIPSRRPSVRIGTVVRVRDDVDTTSPTAAVEIGAPSRKRKLFEKYPIYTTYVQVCWGHSSPSAGEPVVQIEPFDCRPHNALVPPACRVPLVYKELSSPRNFPLSMTLATVLPTSFFVDFSLVPSLNHLFSGRATASALVQRLSFPPLDLALLNEALTAPSSTCGWDYQRLEHVGDSALKLFTSVHLYLERPRADEGRLSRLRMNSVDNRSLRLRSLESGLSEYLLPHTLRLSTFVPETSDAAVLAEDGLSMTKKISRRLLCDTVEATLGAALLSNNTQIMPPEGEVIGMKLSAQAFDLVLAVGDRLGLCFGGTVPWHERPSARKLLDVEPQWAGTAFRHLETALGYTFRTQGALLVQALTHRSWVGPSAFCYEREEYLGDALLDTWATVRLVERFPRATPAVLTFLRALLVSNGTIAALAVRKLGLHQIILHSSPTLEAAMRDAVIAAEAFTWEDVARGDLTFLWAPPKVLGDVFEAILAVIFLDSNLALAPVFAVLDRLYAEILPTLRCEGTRDPYSRLLLWKDATACRELVLRVTRCSERTDSSDTTVSSDAEGLLLPVVGLGGAAPRFLAKCTFHGRVIAEHQSDSKAVARQLAAKTALEVLTEEPPCGCREALQREKREEAQRRMEVEVEDGAPEEEEEEEEVEVDASAEPVDPDYGLEGAEKEDEEEKGVEDEPEEVLLPDDPLDVAGVAGPREEEPLLRVRQY